ncbi:ankyrin repeat protein, partial [Fusarium circinatum]
MASLGDIIALVQAAAEIVDYSRDVRHAKEEMQQLHEDIQILEETLKGFLSLSVNITGENKEVFERINSRIKHRMDDLKKKLAQQDNRFEKHMKRLLWPLKKEGLKEDIKDIESLDNQLRKVLQTQELQDQRYQKLVASLTPNIKASIGKTPYRVATLTEGTGEWIWDEEAYQDWGLSGTGILWVHGIQGSGKTGMAEYIGNKLRDEAGDPPEYHVGRVFCDHQTLAGLEDHMDIIMSLWAQLVDSIGGLEISPKVLKEWTTKIETGQLLSRKNLVTFKTEVMSYTIAQAGRTVLILDGLDEVPSSDLQRDLVDTLREIQNANKQCRRMVTSRPYGSISAMFIKDPKLQLEATSHDIELYIRDRISRSGSHFLSRHKTAESIISQLREKCDGTFLMAKLHMDEVLKADNQAKCWSIIRNLPEKASQAYEMGLKRLAEAYTKPEGHLPCNAIQALFWVASTKAPMKAQALRQALAIELTDTDYQAQREICQGVDTLCGEMLIVDPSSQEVQVAHKTITDYLLEPTTQARWFPNVDQHIHLTLIRYLSLNDLNRPLHDSKSIDQFRNRHPLLPYALMYWGEGLSKTIDRAQSYSSLWKETERFLMSSHEAWNSQVLEQVAEMIEKKSQRPLGGYPTPEKAVVPGRIGGLHWAVIFSLKAFVGMLYEHERQSSSKSGISLTPLGLAAAHDRADMAQVLLEAGASVDGDDYNGHYKRPPLYDAMFCGHKDIVSRLLERGACVSLQRTDNDQTPLDLLHETGLEPLVPMIVEAISKRPLMSFHEYLLLVRGAFTKELQMAIRMGLDINQHCGNGKNALDYALELGNKRIISILKDHGAVPRLQWEGWRSGSSGYLHNCPEPYMPGTRIVKERCWGEDEPDEVYSPGGDQPIYDFDISSDLGGNSSHPYLGLNPRDTNSHLLMEVTVDEVIQLPVRTIVFETVSHDQGWSSHKFQHTYLSCTRSWFDMRVCNGSEQSQVFRIQHNVHADESFRMHTNIWDLEELEAVSPLRAELIRGLRHGSKLQIFSHAARGRGWQNIVSMVR